MTLDEPEYEVIGLSLKQRIALWRVILKVKLRVLLGLPPYGEQTLGS